MNPPTLRAAPVVPHVAAHPPVGATALARALWARYEARDWSGARALFASDAVAVWWATRERFDGPAAIVGVNAAYPEGWRIHLLEVQMLADGRALTLVRVDQDGRSFYGTSLFTCSMDGDRIVRLEEYWADGGDPPDWRNGLPGRGLLPEDRRRGLG